MMLAQQKIHLIIDVPYLPQCTTNWIAKSINSTTQDFNYMLHYNSKEHVLEFFLKEQNKAIIIKDLERSSTNLGH